MSDIKNVVEESFIGYAGAVLQNRALVDVRDALKPSARQIFYCMETDKFIASKPFKKTLKAVGSAMRMYIHGDSSCEGVIMRAGQPFAMRYPLVEIEGSYGNLMESGNWAASRYTSARLSSLASFLFKDIDKDTIDEWRDNYDDTEKYPAVLPCKGYYNLCNGTMGIGVGAASSIPQFNLKELNIALIRLLVNPNIDFDSICCMPDFATGGILLNAAEVKESLRKGTGASCRLRSVIEYDKAENCFVVTEIPYGVYTNTICGQLEEILESDQNPGISRFNDLTGATPLIKIYLNKGANSAKVLQWLYKNTSLEYYYGVNFTMLEDGRYPRVFGFKEALLSYLEHQKIVYRRSFEFDLAKIAARLNIINGLLIAIADIDNVIKIIKNSKTKEEARQGLIAAYNFNLEQVKAILDMKLSRLTNLETADLQTEKGELMREQQRIEGILADTKLLYAEIEKDLRAVMNKFGDARRTQIVNVVGAEDTTDMLTNDAVSPPQDLLYLVVDGSNVLPLLPEDKINLAKKGSPYAKNKVSNGFIAPNSGIFYGLDAKGTIYRINATDFSVGTISPLNFSPVVILPRMEGDSFITVTTKGTVKKSLMAEYSKITRPTTAVKVREEEKLLWAGCARKGDRLLLLTEEGKLLKLLVDNLTSTGRNTIGIKGTSANVVAAALVSEGGKVFMIADGKGKFTNEDELIVGAKGGPGQVIAPNTTNLCVPSNSFYVIEKGSKLTKYNLNSFTTKGKTAQGAKVTDEAFVILTR